MKLGIVAGAVKRGRRKGEPGGGVRFTIDKKKTMNDEGREVSRRLQFPAFSFVCLRALGG
jgi:hypothetical protein